MHAYVTETTSPAPGLIALVRESFNSACMENTTIDPEVLKMPGMSGRKYRIFINNLIKRVDNPRYLEIGTWAGSTLCSAINGNRVTAVAIDNWSEFGGPKAHFEANLQRFRTSEANVRFIESDFRKVAFSEIGKFNIYLYDGPHSTQDQYDGIMLVQPALEEQFILIVDDWNLDRAREGTYQALARANLSILYSLEIRTTLDNSHGQPEGAAGDWHNGYFFSVIERRPMVIKTGMLSPAA
jgi:Methyltransferase domain